PAVSPGVLRRVLAVRLPRGSAARLVRPAGLDSSPPPAPGGPRGVGRRGRPRSRNGRLQHLTVIARVLPLLLVGGLACSALGQGTLAEYSGNGSSNTRPFSAPSGWEVQWNATGDIFQVYVFDMEGDLVEVAANQMGPGSGASFIAREGTYYLQVNAMGSWALRVVQLPPQSVTRLSGSISFSGDGIQN